jgi:hypothetical protein
MWGALKDGIKQFSQDALREVSFIFWFCHVFFSSPSL